MTPDAPGHRPPLATRRLLGEGVGAALIRTDGEIDWWCPNRFEATPVLWSLLDPDGGRCRWADAEAATWDACPAGPTSHTTVRVAGRRVELWDGLVAVPGGSMLVRLARSLSRDVRLTGHLRTGGFDGPPPRWQATPVRVSNGQLVVTGTETPRVDESGDVAVDLTASPDRWTGFAVVAVDGPGPDTTIESLERAMLAAEATQRRAMERLRLPRRHPSRATDALLVLRALTNVATGAPVAAPTTSLPEAPGGQRQFDYRYSWLRDSGLAIGTAAALGHLGAASRYLEFVARLLDGDLRPLSTSDGTTVPREREVSGVSGWAASRPVRVGNAARDQVQLDAVATIIDAVWSYVSNGGAMDRSCWSVVDRMADRLAEAPFAPTSGVWELRTPRHLVSEEIARWNGLDSALRFRRRFRPWLRRPAWRSARDRARRLVEDAIDPTTGRLPQTFDADDATPDAAALTAPIFGLLGRDDPRAARLTKATIEALEQGAFLRRYPPSDDGFEGVEATFVPASWWAVTALATVGEVDAARDRADELCLALPPLQPEEWDVEGHEPLGNTPLLWSHMEAARSLYVLQREELRSRVGTVGVGVWSMARYLRLRLGRSSAMSR